MKMTYPDFVHWTLTFFENRSKASVLLKLPAIPLMIYLIFAFCWILVIGIAHDLWTLPWLSESSDLIADDDDDPFL